MFSDILSLQGLVLVSIALEFQLCLPSTGEIFKSVCVLISTQQSIQFVFSIFLEEFKNWCFVGCFIFVC